MRLSRTGLQCVLAMVLVGVLAGIACSAVLPIDEGFEGIAPGVYPSADGWLNLVLGKSGYVSELAAFSGARSLRLDSLYSRPRVDYLWLEVVPDRISYGAAVCVDAAQGRSGRLGFVTWTPSGGVMWNHFEVNGRTSAITFVGVEETYLGVYAAGTWCEVRADLNFGSLTADLWVDGEPAATGVPIVPKEFYADGLGEVTLNQLAVASPQGAFDGFYLGSVVYFDDVWAEEPVTTVPVDVDVKPGGYPNPINLKSKGLVPVAIFSDEGFAATEIDPATVLVAGAAVAHRGKGCHCMAHFEDVDGDGLLDLVVQVETQELVRAELEDGYAEVTGATYAGEEFAGWDEVVLVPKK